MAGTESGLRWHTRTLRDLDAPCFEQSGLIKSLDKTCENRSDLAAATFTPSGMFETIYGQTSDELIRPIVPGCARASGLFFLIAPAVLKMPIRTARFFLLHRVQGASCEHFATD